MLMKNGLDVGLDDAKDEALKNEPPTA